MYKATGSASDTLPRSTRIIIDVAVATILVNDARSKIVSTVIAPRFVAIAPSPKALRYPMPPFGATRRTAPGVSLRPIEARAASSILARRSLDIPTDSGGVSASFFVFELFAGLCAFSEEGIRSDKKITETIDL